MSALVQILAGKQRNEFVVLRDGAERLSNQALHRLYGISLFNLHALLPRTERLVGIFQHGNKKIFLAAKVVVQHVFAEPKSASNAVDACAVVSLCRKLIGRVLENELACSIGIRARLFHESPWTSGRGPSSHAE